MRLSWSPIVRLTSRFRFGQIRGLRDMAANDTWVHKARSTVPVLRGNHKGQSGRIGVVGGSLEYTGAPYFAAISALKVGADLVHVFCSKEASPVIKSYSPELIVHPLLDDENKLEEIKSWLDRIHVLVIGPGLGRDVKILNIVEDIIIFCKEHKKPLVIDADGLFLITQKIDLIRDYPLPGVILTPNQVEFERLYEVIKMSDGNSEHILIDYDKLGKNVLILKKGATDQTFSSNPLTSWSNSKGGSGRRCGGQGDVLSGATATFFHWGLSNSSNKSTMIQAAVATHAASKLTRLCNEKAFATIGRGMVCSDMIDKIWIAFKEEYENLNTE